MSVKMTNKNGNMKIWLTTEGRENKLNQLKFFLDKLYIGIHDTQRYVNDIKHGRTPNELQICKELINSLLESSKNEQFEIDLFQEEIKQLKRDKEELKKKLAEADERADRRSAEELEKMTAVNPQSQSFLRIKNRDNSYNLYFVQKVDIPSDKIWMRGCGDIEISIATNEHLIKAGNIINKVASYAVGGVGNLDDLDTEKQESTEGLTAAVVFDRHQQRLDFHYRRIKEVEEKVEKLQKLATHSKQENSELLDHKFKTMKSFHELNKTLYKYWDNITNLNSRVNKHASAIDMLKARTK